MKLPTDLFLNNVSPRKVYLFSSDKLNTDVPHYFVCMVRTSEEMLILTCCTSQFKKRERFIRLRNLPASTLVYVAPDEENGLTKDTYVDCNSYFDYSIDEIKILYEEEKLEFKGELSEASYALIIKGLKDSPLVEQNIKNILPKLDTEN